MCIAGSTSNFPVSHNYFGLQKQLADVKIAGISWPDCSEVDFHNNKKHVAVSFK